MSKHDTNAFSTGSDKMRADPHDLLIDDTRPCDHMLMAKACKLRDECGIDNLGDCPLVLKAKGFARPVNHAKALHRDGYRCRDCGDDYELEVHHRDRNRKNNKLSNLETLCKRCHMVTRHSGYVKLAKQIT